VTEAKQLDLIRRSGIGEVWIDTSKGLDVPMEETDVSALETMLATMIFSPDPPPHVTDIGPCSLDDELERAGRIVAQGRGAMKLMFQDVRLGKAIDTEHCLPLVHDITQSIDRNPGAIVSLARLKTSDDYTYMHSVAVCALMIALARKLRLSDADTREAGVAGLIHDIGKAVDHEVEGPHAAIGAGIAQRHNLPFKVINGIAAHHQEVEYACLEAPIVQVADAISASRPGARGEAMDTYVKRLEDLQEIAESFGGVERSFAVQAGREVRILVRPEEIDDLTATRLARDIVKKIEEQLTYPGQIKVTVIRETRAVEYAK